ncbi:metallophosphoesterase [Pirellulaceae bacterium SH449]
MRPRTRRADRDKDRRFMPLIWRDPNVRGRSYLGLTKEARYSIQVGDLSQDYTDLVLVESSRHRVIAGNHDNLPKRTPHFLGDFGVHQFPLVDDDFSFFYVRGAASIDRPNRIEGLNWWYEEELDDVQQELALRVYVTAKPKVVVSHDCPTELLPFVGSLKENIPLSRTNRLLQRMLENHAPQWWFFGHHHKNYVFQHPSGTRFICLGSLAYFDFDETGKSLYPQPK